MIYTIGHSTMPLEEFRKLTQGLDVLLDIRSHPTSRLAHFTRLSLQISLPNYQWEPRLGGWTQRHLSLAEQFAKYGVDIPTYAKGKFPKQRIAKKIPDAALFTGRPGWTSQGLYDYSFYMTLPEFLQAADDLMELGKTKEVGIFCCELLWWKCHRSMVADYLVFRGVEAIHLQPKRTLHSKVLGNRILRYEPEIVQAWDQWAHTDKLVEAP